MSPNIMSHNAAFRFEHSLAAADGEKKAEEKRLSRTLLNNYEKLGVVGRPVAETSETMQVSHSLKLIQILELCAVKQQFKFIAWPTLVRFI